jgi:hypothetical protein
MSALPFTILRYEADIVDVKDGALILVTNDEFVVKVLAPGTWKSVQEVRDAEDS